MLEVVAPSSLCMGSNVFVKSTNDNVTFDDYTGCQNL